MKNESIDHILAPHSGKRVQRMNKKKFTDNQLAQLFLELKKDFQTNQQSRMAVEEITQTLWGKLTWSLQNGRLKDLDSGEKQKAYQVFDTLIQSMPAYQQLPKEQKEIKLKYPSIQHIHHHHYRDPYCNHSDPLLSWAILSSFSRPTYINNNYGGYGGSHHHGRKKKDNEGDKLSQLILVLMLMGLALSALILTLFTLRELVDCGDRLIHNEGMLRAITSMSLMTVSGMMGAFIGSVLLAGPLTALAVAAGMSPVGVNFLATLALTLIGSGLSALLTNQFRLQELFISKNNKDALDPSEPQRFSLTLEQESKMKQQGWDIIKVKCAMVAIRDEMANSHVHDKVWRMFTNKGQSHQKLLEQLRNLKEGQCADEIQVGDMYFDLRAPMLTAPYYHQNNQTQPYVVKPSAPPFDDPGPQYSYEEINKKPPYTSNYQTIYSDCSQQQEGYPASFSSSQPLEQMCF